MDLKHIKQAAGSNLVGVGIDLSEFYLSVEWDILEVPARRNEEYYPSSQEPYCGILFLSSYQSIFLISTSHRFGEIENINNNFKFFFILKSVTGNCILIDTYLIKTDPLDLNFHLLYCINYFSILSYFHIFL